MEPYKPRKSKYGRGTKRHGNLYAAPNANNPAFAVEGSPPMGPALSTDLKLREPPMEKSLNEWGTYVKFIEDQVDEKVKNNANIPSLACRKNYSSLKEKITYLQSAYDDALLKTILKKYTAPTYYTRSKESLTQYPSFLRVFKDDAAKFWPHLMVYFGGIDMLKNMGFKRADILNVEFARELFRGEHDAAIRSALESKREVGEMAELYADEFRSIFEAAKEKPVGISNFVHYQYSQETSHMFHATAGIVFKKGDEFVYGVYDPIFYTRGEASYIWPTITTYLTVKLVAESLGVKVSLMNLSEFCIDTPNGKRCPQYIMDAEFCLYYSLYFLYSWASIGAPTEEAGLQRAVKAAYIVEPSKLRREPCIANKRFRLISMGFILAVILLNVETEGLLIEVRRMASLVEADGFDLLHPDLRELLPPLVGFKLEGGRTRRRRTRKASKKSKKSF